MNSIAAKRIFLYTAIILFFIADFLSLSRGTGILEGIKKEAYLNFLFPLFFVAVLVITVFAVKGNLAQSNITGNLIITLIFAMSALYFASLKEDTLKVHFLEYELLTLLFFKALEIDIRTRWLYPLTIIAITVFGITEEISQALYPDRSFDLRDIKIDIFASLFMIAIIFFFREKKLKQLG